MLIINIQKHYKDIFKSGELSYSTGSQQNKLNKNYSSLNCVLRSVISRLFTFYKRLLLIVLILEKFPTRPELKSTNAVNIEGFSKLPTNCIRC